MGMKAYPVIDLIATGNNIRRLRMERGLTGICKATSALKNPAQSTSGRRARACPRWTISTRSERSLRFR